ncbi:MAG: hypothetical protein H6Q20_2520 [Bacteroidetes bacterium]|nr:hypothetical protein [Bacteroidota bacterium]
MKVLVHHIYEYKKGLRHLVLHTLNAVYRDEAENKLKAQHIDYFIQEVTSSKINLFFGDKNCVNVVREIITKKLNELSPEEDFILGTMLGYDRIQQCIRYLQWKQKAKHLSVSSKKQVA